ncbi:MAG TPA: cation-translocating P-type ATPase [Actinomycetota bacterium]|nr:cation-translocating P-type ATPase [Actinomycetota bacterium]
MSLAASHRDEPARAPDRTSVPADRLRREPWHLSVDAVARELHSDPARGLSTLEADARASLGSNELDEKPPAPGWLVFMRQFKDTMILVLIGAAALTAIVGDVKDVIVILGVITLNAAVGYVQERKAQRAMAALRRLTTPLTRVYRDGAEVVVPSPSIVVGDVLCLVPGDVVAADARVLETARLSVNESALTGESVPVAKVTDPLPGDRGRLAADRRNMVFKGTAVTYGRGRAVVTAIGMSTELGRIAGLLRDNRPQRTPLQVKLALLGRRLAFGVLLACALLFAVGVIRGEPALRMLLAAISLAVAAIPETLPAVVTIALALGAQRMSRMRAIIRKLPAVETLGSVTVIATDKTGTLTQNRMKAERVWTLAGEFAVGGEGYNPEGAFVPASAGADTTGLQPLLLASVLCNDASMVPPASAGEPWQVSGDPTEGALLVLAAKTGILQEAVAQQNPRVAEIPFDAARKQMTTVHEQPDGLLVAVKGAPEVVMREVTSIHSGGRRVAEDLKRARSVADAYAQQGFRVLAIAGRSMRRLPGRPEELEQDLTLYGLVALRDPPRPEARAAVAAAKNAGIVPVVVTGDHPQTARAIATDLGILDGGRVMTGEELSREGASMLARHVADVRVYARTTPEQKLDIINAWKSRGDIVAMTGDGVNDAPALQQADIGIAMGWSGTEVSKEAADMVLADDNFATIVTAVREGRAIYDNIRRFIHYGLTGGTAELWVMLLAPLFGLPLALLRAQILWINLVTHGLPGLALATEAPEPDALSRPPRAPNETLFARGLWQRVLVFGALTGLLSLGLGVWAHASGRPWRTMIFTSLALLQLGNAMAVRSDRQSLFRLGVFSNRLLAGAVFGTTALQVSLPYLGPIRSFLGISRLSAADLAIAIGVSTLGFASIEMEKAIGRVRARHRDKDSGRDPDERGRSSLTSGAASAGHHGRG